VPPTITHATNHIRNGLSGGFFSGLLDPDAKVYVRFERKIGSKVDTVIDLTAMAQKEGRDTRFDWTEVMLLGNNPEQDTAARPLASIPLSGKAFITNSLHCRFYRLPPGVKIRLDPVYHRFDNPRMFSPMDERYERFQRTESVPVPDLVFTIHFLHDPTDRRSIRVAQILKRCAVEHHDNAWKVREIQPARSIGRRSRNGPTAECGTHTLV
jgi:hypothetical protein